MRFSLKIFVLPDVNRTRRALRVEACKSIEVEVGRDGSRNKSKEIASEGAKEWSRSET